MKTISKIEEIKNKGGNSAVQKINQTSGSNISNKNHYLNIGRLTIYKRGIEYYGNL